PLRQHIKCIWRLCGPRQAFVAPEPIVPDGCVEVVLNFADRFIRHVPGELQHRQPARLVAGQITRAVTLEPSGRVDLWGIRFHPWSASTFLGISGDDLRDQFVSLDEAFKTLDAELRDVEGARDDQAQYERIIAVLSRRAARARGSDRVLPKLVA